MRSDAQNFSREILEFKIQEKELVVLIFDDDSGHYWLLEVADNAASISVAAKEIIQKLDESPNRWVKAVGSGVILKRLKLKLHPSFQFRSEFDSKEHLIKVILYTDSGRLRVLKNNESTSGALPKIGLSKELEIVRVLIIDDSATIRKLLVRILDKAHGFEIVGEAANTEEADKILAREEVDLITLDIHMPGVDGLTYLEKMRFKPHPPVVMISSVNYNEAVKALRCLEFGAVDYIEKPQQMALESEAENIRAVLKVAAKKRSETGLMIAKQPIRYEPTQSNRNDLIAMGASTGGVEALRFVLSQFPENSPPILIVQHMPPFFSAAFATRLNDLCKISVKEAEDGDVVSFGCAYIAPGGKQMAVKNNAGILKIEIKDDPPVNRHAPSVDYLFKSIAHLKLKTKIVACLLTGMGRDGAEGLLELKQNKVYTIAESEETAVVYGMPREAVRLNAAIKVLPLGEISVEIFKALLEKNQEAS